MLAGESVEVVTDDQVEVILVKVAHGETDQEDANKLRRYHCGLRTLIQAALCNQSNEKLIKED